MSEVIVIGILTLANSKSGLSALEVVVSSLSVVSFLRGRTLLGTPILQLGRLVETGHTVAVSWKRFVSASRIQWHKASPTLSAEPTQ